MGSLIVIARRRSSWDRPSIVLALSIGGVVPCFLANIIFTGTSFGSHTLALCSSFWRAFPSSSVGGGALAACSASNRYRGFFLSSHDSLLSLIDSRVE